MIGQEQAKTHAGFPYPSGVNRRFSAQEVVQLGKFAVHGDRPCVRLIVKLKDGSELFVETPKQNPEEQRWIKNIVTGFSVPSISSIKGWGINWRSV